MYGRPATNDLLRLAAFSGCRTKARDQESRSRWAVLNAPWSTTCHQHLALAFRFPSDQTSRHCSRSFARRDCNPDQFAMSSSPAPAARSSPTAPPGALAFLVHSPTTVANSLPPDVDNKPLARQKRRRTRYALHLSSYSICSQVAIFGMLDALLDRAPSRPRSDASPPPIVIVEANHPGT